MPLAPAAIVASHRIFITRRKLPRFLSCSAMRLAHQLGVQVRVLDLDDVDA